MTADPLDEPLGRAAYEAYGEVVAHLNHRGEPMPAWPDLPERIKRAWVAAALAVQTE